MNCRPTFRTFSQGSRKRSTRQGGHPFHIIAAVHRPQVDALDIEALAKRRLADEYDAAEERGDVAGRGANVPGGNIRQQLLPQPTSA